MNPDRARALLTAELEELGDRAEFAASSAAESASGDLSANEAGTTQHPADFGTEITNRMESEGLVRTVELQRRRVQDALDRLDHGHLRPVRRVRGGDRRRAPRGAPGGRHLP